MNNKKEIYETLGKILNELASDLSFAEDQLDKYKSMYRDLNLSILDEDYPNSERYLRDQEEASERVNPVPQDITLKGIEQALYELINIMRQKQAGTYSPISIFKGAKK